LPNYADVEAALSYTGEERSSRHSTAAYNSSLPRGTVAGSIKLNHFIQQLGIPNRGREIPEQLKFLPIPQQEVTLLKELPVISNNYVASSQKKKNEEQYL
jgi:hypothetical protein